MVQLLVGLVQQHLRYVLEPEPGPLEARPHHARHGLNRILVELPPVHLHVESVAWMVGIVGGSHPQQPSVFQGVGTGGVAQDSHGFLSLLGLQDRRPGSVGVDHAVPIVGIGDPGQGLRAHHQDAMSVPGAEKVVGVDDGLEPAGTAEGKVGSDTGGIANTQRLLDAGRQGGNEVQTEVLNSHVAEVVGHDDVVQGLGIDPGVGQGFPGRLGPQIRRHFVVGGVAPFRDARDLLQLRHHLAIRGRIDGLPIVHEEVVAQEVLVLDDPGRQIATGTDDYRAAS